MQITELVQEVKQLQAEIISLKEMISTTAQSELLTVQDACNLLNISKYKVLTLIKTNKLRAKQTGDGKNSKFLIPRDALITYMQE